MERRQARFRFKAPHECSRSNVHSLGALCLQGLCILLLLCVSDCSSNPGSQSSRRTNRSYCKLLSHLTISWRLLNSVRSFLKVCLIRYCPSIISYVHYAISIQRYKSGHWAACIVPYSTLPSYKLALARVVRLYV